MKINPKMAHAGVRLAVSALLGIVGGIIAGLFTQWRFAPLVGWDTAAIIFLFWIWINLRGTDSEVTAQLAKSEDPSRTQSHAIIILASLASLAAVGVLLFEANNSNQVTMLVEVGLGLFSVVVSWTVVHTMYALRYAENYYKHNSGVNFNDKERPRYSDFAYLAFTLGMTFQVSDTTFTNNHLRRIALKHALLSYLFGTVIVASTINLIAGLIK